MTSVSSISLTNIDEGGGPTISTVHDDIFQSHILTRLDGTTLASTGCASSQLQALCSEVKLWREICKSMWPSVEDPRVRDAIYRFSGGHRKFFSDSFPLIDHSSHGKNLNHPFFSTELMAAVDMHYRGKLIFSKVQPFETQTDWFLSAPFRVELIDPKEFGPTLIDHARENESWLKHLEENLTLSWNLIDPTRKRSVNLSSRRPVSVQRHWLTGDLEVRYAIVMSGAEGTSDWVQCTILVTCGAKEGWGLHVREVSLIVEDMDGRHVNGKESLVILLSALEDGTRRKLIGHECKSRFEEFIELKRQRNERNEKKEKAVDMFCTATGFIVFLSFYWFVFC